MSAPAKPFPRTLEGRTVAYWKFGPLAGQPKVCKLCPNYVVVSSRSSHHCLCPHHTREFNKQARDRARAKVREQHARFWLGISRPARQPLQQVRIRANRRGYEGPLMHVPDGWREIAQQELDRMIARRLPGPISRPTYAAMVACAAKMARFGGRKQWANYVHTFQQQQGKLYKQLLYGSPDS